MIKCDCTISLDYNHFNLLITVTCHCTYAIHGSVGKKNKTPAKSSYTRFMFFLVGILASAVLNFRPVWSNVDSLLQMYQYILVIIHRPELYLFNVAGNIFIEVRSGVTGAYFFTTGTL